jgi:iron complex transport system substrate-binding protein
MKNKLGSCALCFAIILLPIFAQAQAAEVNLVDFSEIKSVQEIKTHQEIKTDQAIKVTDALGRVVKLTQPAKRVVALAPHIVENLFSAGAGHTLVGAVDYCDYPEQAKKIPRVGSVGAFNIEAITALKPDLILLWHSAGGEKHLARFEKLGFTVYVDEAKTLTDIPVSINNMGVLTGQVTTAETSVQAYRQKYAQLSENFQSLKPVSVFYQIWHQPLQTVNNQHTISDVIRLCGGFNVFGDAKGVAPVINIESVLQRNPEAIFASGMGEEKPEWLEAWKQYPSLKAVKNQHLFFIPPDLLQRHTMRIIEGAERLCRALQTVRESQR